MTPAKLYTIKERVVTETSIAYFHRSFCIPEIQTLAFHIPRVRILGTNHCGNTRQKSFKCCSAKQDVLCRCDYYDTVVASFAQKIQYEYFASNRYVPIEVIVMEHFSAPTQTETAVTLQARTFHAIFHSFFSDGCK